MALYTLSHIKSTDLMTLTRVSIEERSPLKAVLLGALVFTLGHIYLQEYRKAGMFWSIGGAIIATPLISAYVFDIFEPYLLYGVFAFLALFGYIPLVYWSIYDIYKIASNKAENKKTSLSADMTSK